MKRALAILFLIGSLPLFAQLQYPDDCYVQDNETGFKILLGVSTRNIEKKYGIPSKKEIINGASSGYKIWMLHYSDIRLAYDPSSDSIVAIVVVSNRFSTSRGITIGSEEKTILEKYGLPMGRTEKDGKDFLFYARHFDELDDVDHTVLVFILNNGMVEEIQLHITTGV